MADPDLGHEVVVDPDRERRSRAFTSIGAFVGSRFDAWEPEGAAGSVAVAEIFRASADALRSARVAAGEPEENLAWRYPSVRAARGSVFVPSTSFVEFADSSPALGPGGGDLLTADDVVSFGDALSIGEPLRVGDPVSINVSSAVLADTQAQGAVGSREEAHTAGTPTSDAWAILRIGLLAALGIMVASVFGVLADLAAGVAGFYVAFSIFCMTDYLASRKNDGPLLLPPTVARAGVWVFLALAVTVGLAAS